MVLYLPDIPRVTYHVLVALSSTATSFLPQPGTYPNPHLPGTFPSPSKCHQPASRAILIPKCPTPQDPVSIRPPCVCIPGSASSLSLPTPYVFFLPTHVLPLSPCSGCGHLGFSSFIPAMGDAAVEPRAVHPMGESNSGLLCPGRCWRVHRTLPAADARGPVGLALGDVLGTRRVLLPAVGSGLGVSLMERQRGKPQLGGVGSQGISPAGGPVTSWTVPRFTWVGMTPPFLPAQLAAPEFSPWGQAGDKHSFSCRAGKRPPGLCWGWLCHSAASLWV